MKPANFLHLHRIDHLAFGALIMCVVFAPALFVTASWKHALWLAWFAQAAYWLGRERRDEEVHRRALGEDFDPLHDWHRNWNLLEWGLEQRRDFFIPVLGLALVCALVTAFSLT